MPHCTSTTSDAVPWTIKPIQPETYGEIFAFINNARETMFPGLYLAPDSEALFGPESHFLEARDGQTLIAFIGYIPYNNRFPQFDYHRTKTAEVVRLYVLEQYRRCGLAATLFSTLRDRAVQDGVECFYLHTHPFLPGAVSFWKKYGFRVTQVEENPVWQTTHMEAMLKTAKDGTLLQEE